MSNLLKFGTTLLKFSPTTNSWVDFYMTDTSDTTQYSHVTTFQGISAYDFAITYDRYSVKLTDATNAVALTIEQSSSDSKWYYELSSTGTRPMTDFHIKCGTYAGKDYHNGSITESDYTLLKY